MFSSGQWQGFTESDQPNKVVLDLDEAGSDGLSGFLNVYFADSPIGAAVYLSHLQKKPRQSSNLVATYFNVDSGQFLSIEEAQSWLPDFVLPKFSDLSFEVAFGEVIEIGLIQNSVKSASVKVQRSIVPDRSKLNGEKISWTDFKSRVMQFDPERHVFRGQSIPYPLRSSFHRTSRKCLQKYLDQDIPQLHRATSAYTKHVFRLEQPEERGALVALAQHHGFPTPLIDWTYSPYVAAWFAFEKDRTELVKAEPTVRVHVLDRDALKEFKESSFLTWSRRHISSLEPLSIENPRMAPQQGLLTLTNIDDVEEHLSSLSDVLEKPLLRAFDIPFFEREKALRELRLMGITRKTLFPGLDGICGDLKERFF